MIDYISYTYLKVTPITDELPTIDYIIYTYLVIRVTLGNTYY